MKKSASAFTLIELLVVSTIIIMLTVIGIASFSTASKSSRDARRKTDLETIRQAMVLYKVQNGDYAPAVGGSADQIKTALLTNNLISPPFPVDPTSAASYQVGTVTDTDFCFCADVESDNGNSSGSCANWVTSGGLYYCVEEP